MTRKSSIDIVEHFWREVWQARNPQAVDGLVTEDFTITSGGVDICSRAEFKRWIASFLAQVKEFEFHIVETFQNESGDRVASRFRIEGRNNGFLGLPADQARFEMTGTAIWHVREDGLLHHNWVERNALEVQRALSGAHADGIS
jgi:hypothetical protein